jgi:hypothetical protein
MNSLDILLYIVSVGLLFLLFTAGYTLGHKDGKREGYTLGRSIGRKSSAASLADAINRDYLKAKAATK